MAWDVLVIGGGPAGLSAAINVRARGQSVLVVSNPAEENPLWRAEKVDNYPGLPGISGRELLERLHRHAESQGAAFRTGKALTTMKSGKAWYVSIGSEMESAAAVVLASGISRGRKFPGEAELLGRGVSYCATCDGMLYRGRRVVVAGYTPSAEKEADFLREIGCQVTYFDRPREMSILGGDRVSAVECDRQTVEAEGVFLLRPTAAPDELFPGLALQDGYISADRRMATNLPGVFAAGDCLGAPLQAAKAVGEGLIAGQSAAAYAAEVKQNG